MKIISAQELKKWRDAGESFTLVNTLPSEKFAETKIPGAVNFPESAADFAQQVEDATGGKDKPVVVYCASADCDSSTQGARKLEEAGFLEVYDFEEGARGWQHAFGGPAGDQRGVRPSFEKEGGRKAKEDAPAKRPKANPQR